MTMLAKQAQSDNPMALPWGASFLTDHRESALSKVLWYLQGAARGRIDFLNAVLSGTLDAPADFIILLLRSKCRRTPHILTLLSL